MPGRIDPRGGVGQPEEGKENGALLQAVRSTGGDGNMETAIREGEVVGKGAVGTKMDLPPVHRELGSRHRAPVDDELGVHMHGKGPVLSPRT